MADKMKTNRRTIQQQIQVAIIAISILSMLILGVSIFALTTNNIVENYQQDFYYSLQTSDNIVELQLDSIIEEMRNLLLKAFHTGINSFWFDIFQICNKFISAIPAEYTVFRKTLLHCLCKVFQTKVSITMTIGVIIKFKIIFSLPY